MLCYVCVNSREICMASGYWAARDVSGVTTPVVSLSLVGLYFGGFSFGLSNFSRTPSSPITRHHQRTP